ncbi:MAG TPA: FdtA/QdtA family cupin domain-containing protein [Reyranella sp.]|jgi:dTDP-4-dehydrorhamnose 3,5-epimerase-like enzyme|nr:FdtA/QdtA family cupin domain-containing protein [Reyranella sp.]
MKDTLLKARDCRWISVPGAADARGRINFLELGKGLDFRPVRLFWLYQIAAGQWRGRHGHRQTKLVFVPVNGSCRVHLDDGKVKESVTLDDPAKALYVAPWVWHELTDFAPQTAIVIVASSVYDEADYLRDYDVFNREVRERFG